MNKKTSQIIAVIIGIVIIIFLVNGLVSGYNYIENTIPNASCDELLTIIQKDGIKLNIQSQIQEWIAQECWK